MKHLLAIASLALLPSCLSTLYGDAPKSSYLHLNAPATVVYAEGFTGWGFFYEPVMRVKNLSDEPIKYVVLELECFNAVGDVQFMGDAGTTKPLVRVTGPLEPGAVRTQRWELLNWNQANIAGYYILSMHVTFMDNTTWFSNDRAEFLPALDRL